MAPAHRPRILRASLSFAISAICMGSLWYFSPGMLSEVLNALQPVRIQRSRIEPIPPRPRIEVYCPTRAYESETIRLTLWVTGRRRDARPFTFVVETSEKIEVQGDKRRRVQGTEDWFLIPREQGEYEVVVRGSEGAEGLKHEQPLSVYKLDHIPRRWFIGLATFGTILGAIGTLVTIFRKRGEKPSS